HQLDRKQGGCSGELHRGMFAAREAGHVGEEAVDLQVARGEDVALPGFALLVGEQVAGGDVADVDDVEAAVDVGGNAAKEEPPTQLHRRAPGVVRTEDERRVDDYHGKPVRGEPKRLHLGLVLRVHVGDAER